VKLRYAIVLVTDMARSVAFYRDVLGLPLEFESPDWSEFAMAGTAIALHRASGGVGPAAETAGTCRLAFQVAELDAAHDAMLAADVACVRPPQLQQYGVRQAAYRDPDGLVFTLTQSPARR
jgi:lactoylglutathione lyase